MGGFKRSLAAPAKDLRETSDGAAGGFWRLAWPACVEGLFLVMLSSIDLMMVSRLGAEATSAVGVFSQPKMVLLCFPRSLSVAVTAQLSFLYGRREMDRLSEYLKQSVALVLLGAAILCGAAFWQMEAVLRLAGAKSSYINLALSYGRPMMISLFFSSVSTVIHGGLLAGGKTDVMLFTNVAGNLLNIAANGLLIYGLGPFLAMGVAGAAWGTVCGASLTLALTLKTVLQTKEVFHLRGLGHWLPGREYFAQTGGRFAGIFTEQAAERAGMFLYSAMAAGLGAVPFAVHTICMNLCDLYYCFAQGLGKASMTLSGCLWGAEDREGLRALSRRAVRTGLLLSCAACAALGVRRQGAVD